MTAQHQVHWQETKNLLLALSLFGYDAMLGKGEHDERIKGEQLA